MRVPFLDLAAQRDEVAVSVLEDIADVQRRVAFVHGYEVAEFEREFAEFCGVKHCVGVGSGTDAVELSLRACGIGPGDEVIVPANTFVATAAAVVRAGARPRLVDCDDRHLLIDVSAVSTAITSKTTAIVPVHLYGQMVPMEGLSAAIERDLVVVEDAAQAHGASHQGVQPGSTSAAAATSFYPSKNLGGYGDGGAVLTNSLATAERIRRLGNHGGLAKGEHDIVGFTSRLDTLQAAVLRRQLRKLDERTRQRRAAAERYSRFLEGVPNVRPPIIHQGGRCAWHLYVVRVEQRDLVRSQLAKVGIETLVHYPVPVHLTSAFAYLGYRPGDFPVAERAASEVLSLPIFPGITPEQQEYVVEHLARALASA